MYRNIFDHCLSRVPSEQSSLMTSPAHTKNEVREHPSIISSTFCSSKKFHLQAIQLLATEKDSRKKNMLQQSRRRHASMLGWKTNIHIDGNFSDPAKVCNIEKRCKVLIKYRDNCWFVFHIFWCLNFSWTPVRNFWRVNCKGTYFWIREKFRSGSSSTYIGPGTFTIRNYPCMFLTQGSGSRTVIFAHKKYI